MKKILEVLQYGDIDIRFNTDIDVMKNPEAVQEVIAKTSLAMATTLWGGNEQSVLAMIRALSIADLGVSVNRKEMIRFLDDSSRICALTLEEWRKMLERKGTKVQVFPPNIKPSGTKS
ncbi:MAG: hypothetical protein J5382_00525 [Bacteroidales bacterium]|nr:hypothetical protein [Bacteroidales bacterium]